MNVRERLFVKIKVTRKRGERGQERVNSPQD
jgi:hypothetical protein